MPEIVFESTGIYSRPVETFCQKNQLNYYVLNPLPAKQQMEKESLRKWKADKRDAHRLAQLIGIIQGRSLFQLNLSIKNLETFQDSIKKSWMKSDVCACICTTPSN